MASAIQRPVTLELFFEAALAIDFLEFLPCFCVPDVSFSIFLDLLALRNRGDARTILVGRYRATNGRDAGRQEINSSIKKSTVFWEISKESGLIDLDLIVPEDIKPEFEKMKYSPLSKKKTGRQTLMANVFLRPCILNRRPADRPDTKFRKNGQNSENTEKNLRSSFRWLTLPLREDRRETAFS